MEYLGHWGLYTHNMLLYSVCISLGVHSQCPTGRFLSLEILFNPSKIGEILDDNCCEIFLLM